MQDATPPRLPQPPAAYEMRYLDSLLNTLRLFFNSSTAVGPISVARINIDIGQLPTEADLADLRSGDVYRDTTADDALKIKP